VADVAGVEVTRRQLDERFGTGVCDSTSRDCQIVFNDGGSLDPTASVRVSISFAP